MFTAILELVPKNVCSPNSLSLWSAHTKAYCPVKSQSKTCNPTYKVTLYSLREEVTPLTLTLAITNETERDATDTVSYTNVIFPHVYILSILNACTCSQPRDAAVKEDILYSFSSSISCSNCLASISACRSATKLRKVDSSSSSPL